MYDPKRSIIFDSNVTLNQQAQSNVLHSQINTSLVEVTKLREEQQELKQQLTQARYEMQELSNRVPQQQEEQSFLQFETFFAHKAKGNKDFLLSEIEHNEVSLLLSCFSCKWLDFIEKLIFLSDSTENYSTDPAQRKELEEYAASQLTYIGPEKFANDEYKMKVIKAMSPESLVKVILLRPTVYLESTSDNTNVITTKTELQALGNIVFTRDQQITTASGVVMGNFSAEQRKGENALMEFVLKKIGVRPIGRVADFNYNRDFPTNSIVSKATIEGGDFLALANGVGALGVGLRSSYTAGLYLMEHNLLGTNKFLMVKDVFDQNQDRMHLDCTCSPLHDKLVLIDETILINDDKLRYVDEWIHLGGYSEELNSYYALNEKRSNIEFNQYLEENGYSIIAIPHQYQLAYGCNMLHLGFINGAYHILTVHEDSKMFIEQHPVFKTYCKNNNIKIVVEYVQFRSITSMYGSLHCSTQVLEREKPAETTERHNSQVMNVEKLFDVALFVPTFYASQETLKEVYDHYENLRKQGKRVYLMNKYKITDMISFKNISAKNVEEQLVTIPPPPYQPIKENNRESERMVRPRVDEAIIDPPRMNDQKEREQQIQQE